jgi:hypothetical protein
MTQELDVLIFRMIAPLIFRHALRHFILYELCNIAPIWYVRYLCACKIVFTFSNLHVV